TQAASHSCVRRHTNGTGAHFLRESVSHSQFESGGEQTERKRWKIAGLIRQQLKKRNARAQRKGGIMSDQNQIITISVHTACHVRNCRNPATTVREVEYVFTVTESDGTKRNERAVSQVNVCREHATGEL